MCDRIGCMHLPNFKTMDFSRRNFLRTTAATTLTMAVSGGFMGPAHAASAIETSTHGTGFCNLNIFLSHAVQTAKDDGVELVFINTPTFAEQVTFLGIGQVDIGLMPYTSFMALFDAGAPVKIVAGGGIEGCVIVSQPGLDTPELEFGRSKRRGRGRFAYAARYCGEFRCGRGSAVTRKKFDAPIFRGVRQRLRR